MPKIKDEPTCCIALTSEFPGSPVVCGNKDRARLRVRLDGISVLDFSIGRHREWRICAECAAIIKG